MLLLFVLCLFLALLPVWTHGIRTLSVGVELARLHVRAASLESLVDTMLEYHRQWLIQHFEQLRRDTRHIKMPLRFTFEDPISMTLSCGDPQAFNVRYKKPALFCILRISYANQQVLVRFCLQKEYADRYEITHVTMHRSSH